MSQSDKRHAETKKRKVEALMKLSETERKLLARFLQIEKENLHLSKPRVKDDLLRAVREVIK